MVTKPGTSVPKISRVLEVVAAKGEGKEGGAGGDVATVRVQMLEDGEAAVPLGEVRRLDGVALDIAEAAMGCDIGRVLLLGGGEGEAAEAAAQGVLCLALFNLARNAANQVAIAEQGGIAALIGAMGRFEGSEGVQKQGCWALKNLAVNGKKKS